MKSAIEKLTDAQITTELADLNRQISRTSNLSPDQSRIQMYGILEI